MTGFVRRLALACVVLSSLAAAGAGSASAASPARTAFPIAAFDGLASRFVTIGDVTYFEASSPAEGTSLWKSDGTADGTRLVKNVSPDYSAFCCPPDEDPLVRVGGTLFFQGHDPATGYELWKSDGTNAGTQIVKDLVRGSESGGAQRLTGVGDKLFFLGTNAYLFASDGTEAGTQLVPTNWFFPFDLTEADGLLFFNWEFVPDQRFDLYRSDGTQAGTYRVGPRSNELTDVNGMLYFTTPRPTEESQLYTLWKSDGTQAGTVVVKEIDPASEPQGSSFGPSLLTDVNGVLFFAAQDSTNESAIWVSDGTPDGTRRVSTPLIGGPNQRSLTNVDGTLFFTAADGPNGRELWKSDGTEPGTQLVQDIRPGAAGSDPSALADVGGKLLFTACDDVTGCEPWLSSPTHPGVLRVADIVPGPDSSNPTDFTVVGNLVLFRVQRDVDEPSWELWGMPLSVLSLECSDGIDDDGDGLIDFDGGAAANGGIPLGLPDPGCFDASSLSYETRQCQNGLDDDGDGQVDFDGGASANQGVPIAMQDPECTQAWRNTERPSLCGLGAELVLVLPLLAWRARRGPVVTPVIRSCRSAAGRDGSASA